jgi:hypothetical protein
MSCVERRSCDRLGRAPKGWSEEQLQILRTEWPGKMPKLDISLLIGKALKTCQDKASELGVTTALPPDWPAELVETAKRMRDQGLTATEIGKRIGKSRNAVLGKMHRIGDARPRKRLSHEEREIRQQESMLRHRSKKRLGGPSSRPVPVSAYEKAAVLAAPLGPPSLKHSITEVSGCRFIEGDDGLCCGHPVHLKTPYCPTHYVFTHQRNKKAA